MAVRAHFEIYHEKPGLLEAVRDAYPEVSTALATSPFFATNPARNRIVFATATHDVVVICIPASVDQLEVVVETLESDIRQAVQNSWRTVRRAGRRYRIRLASLVLVDDATGSTIAYGRSGWGDAVRQRDLWGVFATAIGSGLWLLLLAAGGSGSVGELGLGCVPAFASGLVALWILKSRANKVYWSENGWDDGA